MLYDWGVFRSYRVGVRTIGVGNVAVGGTGKTPHTMAIVERLKGEGKCVAVLSRGYKRQTKGFVLADVHSTAAMIGDEPMLIHVTHPDVLVAVCERRVEGVNELMRLHPEVDVVILDDAFQHRKLRIDYSMVLTAYDRLYTRDRMLPWGRLRDNKRSVDRAQAVVVTKCPEGLTAADKERVRGELKLKKGQELFFTKMVYGDLRKVFAPEETPITVKALNEKEVLMLTGIANPEYMQVYLEQYAKRVVPCAFADHRNFTERDIQRIERMYDALATDSVIITTEKDAMRLVEHASFPDALKGKIYALPIRVEEV